jgi:hypothetical protein
MTPLDLPGLSTSSSSSIASTRSSPRSDLFEPRGDFGQPFEVGTFDTLTLDNQLSRLFPNTPAPLENFGLNQSMNCSPPSAPMQDLSSWLDGGDSFSKFGSVDIFSYPEGVRIDCQEFFPNYAPLAPSAPPNASPLQMGQIMNSSRTSVDSSGLAGPREPTAEDLEHYRMFIFLPEHEGSY